MDINLNNKTMDNKINKAKEFLKSKGYYTDNLWMTDDVKQNYKCDDDEAQNVLYSIFNNEWLTEQIFVMIDEQCEAKGITKKK